MVPNHTPSCNNIEYVTAFENQPKLSTYTQIFGVFDYNRTPLAPIGTKTVGHLRTKQKGRTPFGDHGVIGWTIGPALDHYRHWDFYIPKTRGTRVSDTVVFLPEKYSMPTTASADRASTALEELTEALKNPAAAKPFLNTGNKLNASIEASTEILSKSKSTNVPKSEEKVSPPRVSERTTTVNTTQAGSPGSPLLANDQKWHFAPKSLPNYLCAA
jgi:hypothetical protein